MRIHYIYRPLYVVAQSVALLFILPVSMCSRRALHYFFRLYGPSGLPETSFNLCVEWLEYVGRQVNLTYEEINLVIFCLVWPLITIASIALNIILLCR